MGCFGSKVKDEKPFTESQIITLKMTWPVIVNSHHNAGEKVFKAIFRIDPHIKRLFPFANLPEEDLMSSRVFVNHTKRFMRAVGSVVDRSHDPCVIRCILHALGGRHAGIEAFCPIAFDVFMTAMFCVWEVILGDDYTPEAHDAWGAVFKFIGTTLKQGYQHSKDSRGCQHAIANSHYS